MEGDTNTCMQYIYVCMYMFGKWVNGSFLLLPNVRKSVSDGRTYNEYLEFKKEKDYSTFFYIGLFLPIRCSVSLHC